MRLNNKAKTGQDRRIGSLCPLEPGMVLLPLSWSGWAAVLDWIICLLHSGCFGKAFWLALQVGSSPDCCHICPQVPHLNTKRGEPQEEFTKRASSLWALSRGYFRLISGFNSWLCCCCSVTQLCLTLRPQGLQHTRLPCPSPSLGVCSNSCPLSQ